MTASALKTETETLTKTEWKFQFTRKKRKIKRKKRKSWLEKNRTRIRYVWHYQLYPPSKHSKWCTNTQSMLSMAKQIFVNCKINDTTKVRSANRESTNACDDNNVLMQNELQMSTKYLKNVCRLWITSWIQVFLIKWTKKSHRTNVKSDKKKTQRTNLASTRKLKNIHISLIRVETVDLFKFLVSIFGYSILPRNCQFNFGKNLFGGPRLRRLYLGQVAQDTNVLLLSINTLKIRQTDRECVWVHAERANERAR